MATNYTTNYQLNQWEPTDAVQRVEFNADNAKVDAALKSLSDQVVQKASQSALNTVISAVNQKADAATVSSLSSQLSTEISQRQVADNSLQAALTLKGNCQIYYTSYVGDGVSTSRTLTFPGKPLFVVVHVGAVILRGIYGAGWVLSHDTGQFGEIYPATWTGNSLTWACDNSSDCCNLDGYTYYVVALLAADQ